MIEPEEANIFRQTVSEADIDWLFCVELNASQEFRKWVAPYLFKELNEFAHVRAWRSISNSAGESDLLWLIDTSDKGRMMGLIENKIGAKAQDEQYHRYVSRGESYKADGICQEYSVALLSPEGYRSTDSSEYQNQISYENITNWLRDRKDDRSEYLATIYEAAIDKHEEKIAYTVTQPSEVVTDFWQDYWNIINEIAPEFRMKSPNVKGKKSTYIYFRRAKGLPEGVVLVHKIMNWEGKRQKSDVDYFDLQFSATLQHQLEERYDLSLQEGKRLGLIHDSAAIVAAGQSASIRVEVPPLDIYNNISQQLTFCKIAIERGKELLNFFTI